MSSIAARGYKSTDAKDRKGKYRGPFVMTQKKFNHKNGHFVRPNKVALKYIDFKKDVDPNVHVKMFNSMVKANVKTFEEYIINAFSYTLRNMAVV
jgi:hypothetical protein